MTPLRHYMLTALIFGGLTTLPARADEPPAKAPIEAELSKLTVTDTVDSDYVVPNATTGTKTDTPIMETPISVQVVPQLLLQDQQAYRLDKALNYVSGVTSTPYVSGGGTADNTVIRGFSTGNTYSNGFRIEGGPSATGPIDTANVEQIEVMKGPAAILYGRVEPGGIVNLVRKEPLATPRYSIQQVAGSYKLWRTTLDATGPLAASASLSYRAIFAHEEADSFQDYRSNRHDFLSTAFRWDASRRTKVNVALEYKRAKDPVDYGIPVTDGDRPIDVPRNFSASEPGNRNDSNYTNAIVDWSHAFDNEWSVRQSFAWRNTSSTTRSTASDIWRINYLFGGPVENGPRVLDRYAAEGELKSRSFFTSLDFTGKFSTGILDHTLLLGADYYRFKQSPGPAKAFVATFLDVDTGIRTDLGEGLTGLLIQDAVYWEEDEWFGYYVQDQIKLPGNLQLLAGLRRDHAKQRSASIDFLYGADFDNRSDDYRTTPRLGLLWRALPGLSLYGNYVENFGAPNTTNASSSLGQVPPPLKPQTAKQKELGLKAEGLDGKLISTIALFEIAKQNIAAPDPVNIGRTVLVGEVVHRGWEVDVTGEITSHWRVVLAASGISSKITKDAEDASGAAIGNQGKHLFNVPRLSGSAWATYRVANWTMGGGVVARGRREGDIANSFHVPGYAVMNLMLGYQSVARSHVITAQLNLDNLFDRYYFSATTGSRNQGAYVGDPRTLTVSLKAEF